MTAKRGGQTCDGGQAVRKNREDAVDRVPGPALLWSLDLHTNSNSCSPLSLSLSPASFYCHVCQSIANATIYILLDLRNAVWQMSDSFPALFPDRGIQLTVDLRFKLCMCPRMPSYMLVYASLRFHGYKTVLPSASQSIPLLSDVPSQIWLHVCSSKSWS